MHCTRTPWQSATHVHWILESTNIPKGTNNIASLLLGILAYDKMSYKSFLKFQVGIISLDAFHVFCEAIANTRSL